MPEVFVGAGSNIEPERHLRAGIHQLADRFGVLRLSPVYRNRPVGFDGDDFLNMVIAFETGDSLAEVAAFLASVEVDQGRSRAEAKFAPRTLDLDLLLYGDAVDAWQGHAVPRDEITRYAFVLKPLADLAPDQRHPVLGRSYAELWSGFEREAHPLERVGIELTGGVGLD
jgi:2-amino-4-hydroxy-6-hydroxymethyldihydropteridine diphosphokinase